jgi:transcriptional regulator GlxA family with amidase domain
VSEWLKEHAWKAILAKPTEQHWNTLSRKQTGWLGALRDQQIGRAIALVHRDPARNWTVASLAMAVGLAKAVERAFRSITTCAARRISRR